MNYGRQLLYGFVVVYSTKNWVQQLLSETLLIWFPRPERIQINFRRTTADMNHNFLKRCWCEFAFRTKACWYWIIIWFCVFFKLLGGHLVSWSRQTLPIIKHAKECGNPAIWQSGNLAICQSGILAIGQSGTLAIWHQGIGIIVFVFVFVFVLF